MSAGAGSPVEAALATLAAVNASWRVDTGRPDEPGWVAGGDLRDASRGPFNDLLLRIAERAATADRRTVAASFALRFGWASIVAIGPCLGCRIVPDVRLENVSFRFKPSTFFERAALHTPRGSVVEGDPRVPHPLLATVPDDAALLRELRRVLVEQAAPVVEALYAWSGFARKGTWGMLTSSWAAHFTGLSESPDDQRPLLPTLEAFFAGEDVVSAMQPRMHPVTCGSVTHLYQRRASCCRYYLLPQGDLCTSCPLVSPEERVARNRAWMQSQLERRGRRPGHAS